MSDFTEDDYRKSIVRIFGQENSPIGAGFLVLPGYVMTCAHVVLQAIGIQKEEYSTQSEAPNAQVILDFPILDCNHKITAQVVDWTPYNLDTGDIALLKLTEPEPESVKVIPFTRSSTLSSSSLCIYGFGEDDNGGQTDAYRMKTQTAGGRWMLCKNGAEDDETIQPGYSGAPVWINEENALLGMVAAAKVSQSKAYVIPVGRLKAILKKLELKKLIQSHLSSEEDSNTTLFQQALDSALRVCNPNARNQSVSSKIDQLSDRPVPEGWKQEGSLIRFAIALAWQGTTSDPIQDEVKEWVINQGHPYFELYERFAREMKKRNVQQDNTCEHLLVVLEPEETQPNHFRVSIWPINSRASYQASSPPQPIVKQISLSKTELPKFIRTKAREKIGAVYPMIHLFMPCGCFDDGIEMEETRTRRSLGSEYPLVYRPPFIQTLQNHQAFIGTRKNKWNSLSTKGNQPSSGVFEKVSVKSNNLDAWVDALENIDAAILQGVDSVGEIFKELHSEFSLPVALWVRNSTFQSQLKDILQELFSNFPYTVQISRESAKQSESTDDSSPTEEQLGHHIALVWDDPELLPPMHQFNEENHQNG